MPWSCAEVTSSAISRCSPNTTFLVDAGSCHATNPYVAECCMVTGLRRKESYKEGVSQRPKLYEGLQIGDICSGKSFRLA